MPKGGVPKHGHTSRVNGKTKVSSTYNAWASAKHRCSSPKNENYASYGGRGITFCERWNKFEDFLADMGVKPEGLSLERRDNNQGYNPENCYWASMAEQGNNRRSNHLITFNGETQTLAEWARRTGKSAPLIRSRINAGLPLKDVFSLPVGAIEGRNQKGQYLCRQQKNI